MEETQVPRNLIEAMTTMMVQTIQASLSGDSVASAATGNQDTGSVSVSVNND
jgi:hypothetical protein